MDNTLSVKNRKRFNMLVQVDIVADSKITLGSVLAVKGQYLCVGPGLH